jgi:hypothetical protein
MLTTSSFMEHYLTLLGWVINNDIFAILRDTGIAAIPIAIIVLGELLQARTEGADEGNKAVLATMRIENKVYIAYLVILFAFVPTITVNLSDLKVDKDKEVACAHFVPQQASSASSSQLGKTFEESLGGKTAKIPVWWALIHSLSKGITSAATSAIPCGYDIADLSVKLDATRINDPQLVTALHEFSQDCYGAARATLMEKKPELSDDQVGDTGWVGSNYFLKTDGYYDSITVSKPQEGWQYNASTDAGRGQVKDPNDPNHFLGYPTCAEWWGDATNGLRARLLKQINPTLAERFEAALPWNKGTAEDAMIRHVISPQVIAKNTGSTRMTTDLGYQARSDAGRIATAFGGRVKNMATTAGLAVVWPFMVTGLNALRIALPMIQAFMIMAVIICIPLLLLMGQYQLKGLFAISFGLFAIYFSSFWWELARWIDSSLWTALYAGSAMDAAGTAFDIFTSFTGNDTSVTSMVLQFVEGTLFLALPMFFFMMMGWVGITVGNGMANVLTAGTATAQQGAQQGSKQIVGTAVKIATGGKGGKK